MDMHPMPVDRSQKPYVQRGEHALADEAAWLRQDIVDALHRSGGGHYGGSLSVIDLLITLYRRQLRVVPAAPRHAERDRLILSKGHAAIAQYAVLRRLGFFDHALDEYGGLGSPLEGHPDMLALPGIDFSSGSLGQGLSVGIGMALGLRGTGAHVWVVLGDGECQEGQVWEAAMLAAQCRLRNLTAVVDVNLHQEWGWNRESASPEPVNRLREKWAAFGWQVRECDGHDHEALATTFAGAATGAGDDDPPCVVLAHTQKGKGYALFESDPLRFHCAALSEAEYAGLPRVRS